MNISQSALSQQLRAMELEIGTRLFERNYNGVVPTDTGKIVSHYATEITSSYDRMFLDISTLKTRIKPYILWPTPWSILTPCPVPFIM